MTAGRAGEPPDTPSDALERGRRWPTFVGIGVPKAGTTWLHELLLSHPAIWMPPQRKEIHFFDRYYERGLDWYAQFFPPSSELDTYKAVGEFTPHYLYHSESVNRIAALPSIDRIVVSLRNPVARAFSHYRFRVRIDAYDGSFEQFLTDRPEAIEWGYYGKYLRPYVERFGRDRLLVLVFEHAVADVDRTKRALAAFLGVEARAFGGVATQKVNPSFRPRHGQLYAAAVRTARWLYERDLYSLIGWAKRIGFKRWVSRSALETPVVPMREETRRRLVRCYEDDIALVERLLEIDLTSWKQANLG